MYSLIANLLLVFSLLASSFTLFTPLFNNKTIQNKILNYSITIIFLSVTFAFLSLNYAYLTSDFSLLNVYNNSHLAVPLIYKISGVWSNHEGSMMLWLFILCISNYFCLNTQLEQNIKIKVLYAHNFVSCLILAYTFFYSNPFDKISPAPKQGLGFNPLLQDIGLAIHPPILYIGYVSTINAFALALAALNSKNLSKEIISKIQKYSLFSWCFLLLGISLGSWWAYRELGWGGYWFWDPVENASLLPFLLSTALIHSLYTSKKLEVNYSLTLLLAIFTFLMAILASFFVRSGIVTSVHSFANDPIRGNFILIILSIYSIFSLGSFALKAKFFRKQNFSFKLTRLGGINIGNIMLILSAIIILFSLIYPLIYSSITQNQISIEKEFFKNTIIPCLLILTLLISFSLPTSWLEILKIHYRHFYYSLAVSSAISLLFYLLAKPSLISFLGFLLGSLTIIRMLFWFYLRKQTSLTIKFYLIFLVHLAPGLIAVNISIIETFSKEAIFTIKEGEIISFNGFNINFVQKINLAQNNYLLGKAILRIEKENTEITNLTPQVRYYPVEKTQTSESSIHHSLFYDLYAVISEASEQGDITIKLYYKPLMSWLWIELLLCFIVGIFLLKTHKK